MLWNSSRALTATQAASARTAAEKYCYQLTGEALLSPPPSPHPVRRLRSFLKEDGARAGECLVGVGTRFEAMRVLGQGAKRETVFSTIFHTTTTLARFSYRMLVLPIIVRPSVGPSILFSAPHLVSRRCSLVLSHHVFLSSLFACFHNL